MYASAFVLGFHGCDESVGEKILRGAEHLKPSDNPYDWLGSGIYFWENSPERALHWAHFIKDHPDLFRSRIRKPCVIGALIDLGSCLDLADIASLKQIKEAHDQMKRNFDLVGTPMPRNEEGGPRDEDLVKRHLDGAVINYLHSLRAKGKLAPVDSVRGAFWEGAPLYAGAKIMSRTHVQICVRHVSQVRAYFRPIPE